MSEKKQETSCWKLSDGELREAIETLLCKTKHNIDGMPFPVFEPLNVVDLCDWTRSLYPSIEGLSKRAHSNLPDSRGTGDDFDNCRNTAELAGFYIGILFGARFAGFTDEQMDRLSRGLFNVVSSDPLPYGA